MMGVGSDAKRAPNLPITERMIMKRAAVCTTRREPTPVRPIAPTFSE